MHPSLLKLIWLRMRAGRRQMARGLKTPRGLFLSLICGGMFVLWLGPSLFLGVTRQRLVDPEGARAGAPAVLLLMCVWTLLNAGGDKAVYFSPGEVNFLLGGPFQRRELLVYKLLFAVLGGAVSALVFTIAFLAYLPWWLAAYIGIFLSLGLLQLLGMSCLLIAQAIGERVYSRARKLLLTGLAVLMALVVARALAAGRGNLAEVFQLARESAPGRLLLAVFNVYGQVMTAEEFYPGLFVWGGLALIINCALAGFVLWLDADYSEASVIHSQKQYERLQRMRRGGLAGWSGRTAKTGRLAQLPWLAGAGPIAWRQLLSALRSSRALLVVLILLSAAAFPLMFVMRGGRNLIPVLGMVGWMSVFLTQRITFDFRGDLDHMDVLKSLPLPATSIVLGELITPVLVLTLLQLVIVGVAVVFVRTLPQMLAIGAIALLPVNFVLFEIENLLFLLFPSRQMTGRPTDFQFIGRTMLMMFAKLILVGITAALVCSAGFLVYLGIGRQLTAIVGAGALMLAVIAVALIPCVGSAFRRFDISTETPP